MTSSGPVALAIESDGPGGAERMLLQLAEELRRRGREVVPIGPAVGCGWLAAEFRARGFEPEAFRLRFPFDPACVTSLVRIFRSRGVRVAHSHEFTMGVFGAAAARVAGIPHIITLHGGLGFADRWRRRAALRWACRHSAAVVAVSRGGAELLARRLGLPTADFTVVPNGIRPDLPAQDDVRAELGLGAGELLVLAVGNLYRVKGHAALLRALAGLPGDTPSWHLAIAGRGEEEEALRHLARELGLADRVSLLGYRADIATLLAAADLFVMPSLSEGLPLALLEAMLAGKPVIASAVGGIPEVIVDGESGVLVPPADEVALSRAILRLARDPHLRSRMGLAAAVRAERGYGVDVMTDAYERLYARALTPSAANPSGA